MKIKLLRTVVVAILTLVLGLVVYQGVYYYLSQKYPISKKQKEVKIKKYSCEIKNNNDICFKSADRAIVKFSTDWCGPCKRYEPLFEETAKENNKNIIFCSINGDYNKELCDKYHINAYPTTLVFEKGDLIKRFTGFSPDSLEKEIKEFDNKLEISDFMIGYAKKFNQGINIYDLNFKKGKEYQLTLPSYISFDLDCNLKRYDLIVYLRDLDSKIRKQSELFGLSGTKFKKFNLKFGELDEKILKSAKYETDYFNGKDLEKGSVIGIKTREESYFKIKIEGYNIIPTDKGYKNYGLKIKLMKL